MEKSFIATKESKLYKDIYRLQEMAEQQKKFINIFFEEKGIETRKFMIHGNGIVGTYFEDYEKKEIALSIIPTENDNVKFGRVLTKEDQYGIRDFKRNSAIGKEFAQKCVDNKIIINLIDIDFRDYFKSIDWSAYSGQRFPYGDEIYLKIDCKLLKDDDVPEGFKEIKLSEYHIKLEEYEASKK